LVVVLTAEAVGQAPPVDLAAVVPEKTLLYLGWSGTEQLGPASEGTALGKTLADPQVERFIEAFQSALDSILTRATAEEGAEEAYAAGKRVLRTLGRRPTALAFIDGGFGEEGPFAHLAIVCHVGEGGEAFLKDIQTLLQAAELPPSQPITIADKSMQQLLLPVPGGLFFGLVDQHFIFALGNTTVQEIVARLGESKPSLATSERLAVARKKIGGDAEARALTVYLSPAGLIERITPLLPLVTHGDEEAQRAIQGIIAGVGLNALRSVTYELSLREGGCINAVYVFAPDREGGLLGMPAGKPLTDADLAIIPKQPTWAHAFHFDLGGLYAGLLSLLQTLDADAHGDVVEAIAELESRLELKLDKDLLDLLGDKFVLFDAPENGGIWLTGITAVIDTPDAARAQQSLKKVIEAIAEEAEGAAGVSVASTTYRDHEIAFVNVTGVPMPFAPAWTAHENRLICGLYPQMVMTALDRLLDGGAGQDSLLGNPDFVRARKILGGIGSSVSYVDVNAGVEAMYPWVLGLAQVGAAMAQGEGAEVDIGVFPTRRAVTRHLFGHVGTSRNDEQGVLFIAYGPLPVAIPEVGGAVGVTAMSTAILLPSLARARDLAKRSVCAANLKGIGNACHIYANGNAGRFPPDLDTLVGEGAISPRVLRCPSAGEDEDAYVYIPGRSPDAADAGRTILAHERRTNHDGEGVNVLFVDAHTEWMTVEALDRALEADRKQQ